MKPVLPSQPAVLAVCSRALIVARECESLAVALRAAVGDLLAATPASLAGDEISAAAKRPQAVAVARGGASRGSRNKSVVLAAVPAVVASTSRKTVTVVHSDVDDANLELAAIARYGSWHPPASPSSRPRVARAR